MSRDHEEIRHQISRVTLPSIRDILADEFASSSGLHYTRAQPSTTSSPNDSMVPRLQHVPEEHRAGSLSPYLHRRALHAPYFPSEDAVSSPPSHFLETSNQGRLRSSSYPSSHRRTGLTSINSEEFFRPASERLSVPSFQSTSARGRPQPTPFPPHSNATHLPAMPQLHSSTSNIGQHNSWPPSHDYSLSQTGMVSHFMETIASTSESAKPLGKYECSYCGKRFSRPSSLRIHTNTHTGEKPYRCPHAGCGRSFSVQSNMRRHARVHLNASQQHRDESGSDTNDSPTVTPPPVLDLDPSFLGRTQLSALRRTRSGHVSPTDTLVPSNIRPHSSELAMRRRGSFGSTSSRSRSLSVHSDDESSQ